MDELTKAQCADLAKEVYDTFKEIAIGGGLTSSQMAQVDEWMSLAVSLSVDD